MAVLEGKVAVVTGGAAGIGEALCRELTYRGACVVVVDRDLADAKQVADDSLARGKGRGACPPTSRMSHRSATWSKKPQQPTDTSITCSTTPVFRSEGTLAYLTSNQWRQVLDVDLYGVLYGTLAAYPIMVRQGFGHIVNVSSATGLVPQPINAPYCTAKHAVVGLSLSLRLEGVDLGVEGQCRLPRLCEDFDLRQCRVGQLAQRGGRRKPIKMIEVDQAAQAILDGVARESGDDHLPGRGPLGVACLPTHAFTGGSDHAPQGARAASVSVSLGRPMNTRGQSL